MIASALLISMLGPAPQDIPLEVLRALPAGVQVNRRLSYDFDKDGVAEEIIAGTVIDGTAIHGDIEPYVHVVVALLTRKDGKLEMTSCKEVGNKFHALRTADFDRDGRPDIVVTTRPRYQESTLTRVLRVDGRLKLAGSFLVETGLIEVRDANGDGAADLVANEIWDPNYEKKNPDERIETTWTFKNGSFILAEARRSNRKTGASRPLDAKKALDRLYSNQPFRDVFIDSERFPGIRSNPLKVAEGLPDSFEPGWSPDGTRLLFTAGRHKSDQQELWSVRADGQDLRQITRFGNSYIDGASWSPDGTKISLVRFRERLSNGEDNPDSGFWVVDANGENCRMISTRQSGFGWSADSKKILYFDPGSSVIEVSVADGTTRELPESEAKNHFVPLAPDWSAWYDFFGRADRSFTIPTTKGRRFFDFKPGMCKDPSLSPDRKRIAFCSYKDSAWSIWVMDTPKEAIVPKLPN